MERQRLHYSTTNRNELHFHPSCGDDAMRVWRMPQLYLLTVNPERMQAPVRRFE
jgi:hypothetical protein